MVRSVNGFATMAATIMTIVLSSVIIASIPNSSFSQVPDTIVHQTTPNASAAITTTKVAMPTTVDKFGIEKIYPTKRGGREWYVNMDNPKNDSIFTTSTQQNMIKESDDSWHLFGREVRMHVITPITAQPWKNVEITGYVRVDSIIYHKNSYRDIAWLARSGIHTDNLPCDGTALIGGIHDDGTVGWKKEIWFTGGYTKELAIAKVTDPLLGRWIGWKVVIYNISNDSAVKMESYLDDKNNNHWVKVTDLIDNGGWYADSSDKKFNSANCGKPKDYVMINPGPIVTFRSDNIIWDFKNLSVREIKAS
jgi:hypothetical protein